MRFYYPQSFSTGEVVCMPALETFRQNDEFFNGVADGIRPVQYGVFRGFVGDELSLLIYDGYHLLRDDSKTLYYYLYAQGGGSNTVTTRLYYDGSQVASCQSSGSLQTSSGTVSLSAKSAGIYRVHATLNRNVTGGGQGGLRSPFTRYTGSRSWTSPPTITDGSTSSASHFNTWRDNDLYFLDQVRPVPGFAGFDVLVHDASSYDLWNGWDRFNPEHYRMLYKVYLENTDGGTQIRIYYDYGGGNQQYKTISSAGWSEGVWDLASPGNYTRGGYYRVFAQLTRTDQYHWQKTKIRHLLMTAPAADAGYTVMDKFVPGQYVYGNTGGQGTRLSLLSSNDTAIRDRLIFGDSTNQRQDWACAEPERAEVGGNDRGPLSFVRRFDLLYHRTKGATIYWGDPDAEDSFSLESYDDTGGFKYRVLDLNTAGVPVGVTYRIEGEELGYAAEFNPWQG